MLQKSIGGGPYKHHTDTFSCHRIKQKKGKCERGFTFQAGNHQASPSEARTFFFLKRPAATFLTPPPLFFLFFALSVFSASPQSVQPLSLCWLWWYLLLLCLALAVWLSDPRGPATVTASGGRAAAEKPASAAAAAHSVWIHQIISHTHTVRGGRDGERQQVQTLCCSICKSLWGLCRKD